MWSARLFAEDSGLALSSRNVRLSPDEKSRAEQIYPTLLAARDAWLSGERSAGGLSAAMTDRLNHDGIFVEYAEVRDPARWTAELPQTPLVRAQALIAARVGSVRLIDNLRLDQCAQPQPHQAVGVLPSFLVLAACLEIENRSLFDSGGPTRRQCLHSGVEPNAFRAVHIVIAKE